MTLRRKSPLRTKKPLKSGAAGLRRKGRIKPKKRSAGEYARIYHSVERVQFVAQMECAAAARNVGNVDSPNCDTRWPCIGHHIKTGGTGRKSGYRNIIPLCRAHHDELHSVGAQTFCERHNIASLPTYAAYVEDAWQARAT